MQQHLEHPSEELLERFLLHQMQEEELESIETHVLACESCVARLEDLEIQIAATKIALNELHNQKVAETYAKEKSPRWAWLKVPGLSLAGAAGVLALALAIIPKMGTPVERDLSAFRGSETTSMPANRPLLLHLNAKNLPPEAVAVQVLNSDGQEVWKGKSTIEHETVEARLPRLSTKGNYLLRLYASPNGNVNDNLLREFSFEVE